MNKRAEERGRSLSSVIKEVLLIIVGALLISALLRAFVFEPFTIPSGSMESTLQVDDKVIAQKVSDFERGDVIVFEDPGDWVGGVTTERTSAVGRALEFVGVLPNTSARFLTKRVIGTPGDHVQCCDVEDRIIINGAPLDEQSYLYSDSVGQVLPSDMPFDVVVPRDYLFVLGDHRNASADSRCHIADEPPGGNAGFVPVSHVVGAVGLIVAPFDRWQALSTPQSFAAIPPPGEAPETARIAVLPQC